MGNLQTFIQAISIVGPIVLLVIIFFIVKAVLDNEKKKKQHRSEKQIQSAVKRWRTQNDFFDVHEINKR